jgi:hypothetical protein
MQSQSRTIISKTAATNAAPRGSAQTSSLTDAELANLRFEAELIAAERKLELYTRHSNEANEECRKGTKWWKRI